jgi:hypothetical protein
VLVMKDTANWGCRVRGSEYAATTLRRLSGDVRFR